MEMKRRPGHKQFNWLCISFPSTKTQAIFNDAMEAIQEKHYCSTCLFHFIFYSFLKLHTNNIQILWITLFYTKLLKENGNEHARKTASYFP